MDLSPKFEAAVSRKLLMTNSPGVPELLPHSHAVTQHVYRVVSRILEANDPGKLRSDRRVPAPSWSMLQSGLGFSNRESGDVVPDLWDTYSTGLARCTAPEKRSGTWSW